MKFADESPEPSLDELWRDTIVEPGEEDVRPRERVLGDEGGVAAATRGRRSCKVTWDLEPREQAEEADKKAGLKQPARA